jgi:hypothetical protein
MDDRSVIYNTIALIGTVISSVCGFVNLLLIYDMRIWNSFIFLITAMTIFQLVYDATFYSRIVCVPETFCYNSTFLLQMYGGIAQALVSNEIAFVVFYTIWKRKILNALNHKYAFMLAANIPAAACCLMYFAYLKTGSMDDFNNSLFAYFYIRLISIFVIAITCALTIYYARKITISKLRSHQSVESRAIWALARRLMYYPIVQALARFGFSWFEISYGFDFAVTTVSDAEFAALCVIAVTTPLGGVGYFVIFLVMQPHSWEFLKSRMLTGKRFAGRANGRRVASPLSNVKEDTGVAGSTVVGISMTEIPERTTIAVTSAERPSELLSEFERDTQLRMSTMLGMRESLPMKARGIDFDALDDEELLICIVSSPTAADVGVASADTAAQRNSEMVSVPAPMAADAPR